jgi:hypothetical protein
LAQAVNIYLYLSNELALLPTRTTCLAIAAGPSSVPVSRRSLVDGPAVEDSAGDVVEGQLRVRRAQLHRHESLPVVEELLLV